MKISTKGRYALRMMLDVAQNQGTGYVTLRDISKRQDISKKYLEQIALQLMQAKLLTAMRGLLGGYRLKNEPKDYTVEDILSVMEGPLTPVACLDNTPNECSRCKECITLPMWEGLQKTIHDYLSSITLQDLLPDENTPEQ